MAAVPDTCDDRFGSDSGEGPPEAQVVLGTVMVATVAAVAAAGSLFAPAAAATAAVVMLPLLIAASLRTSLSEHSAYVALAERR
ncbi:hypothetical protein [Haloplanus halophilus]|uniref:hypothetical protein n=1 Tax=Haloplanus halophilus TaxID=2949993 RepID=UPI0020417F0E|nr:hypothetical protein [Haloplanus sp. GDY1]